MTEEELVRLARQGDQSAFEQLVRDNEKRIYNLALRMAGHPEDALDLSQEIFLNAWKGLSAFKGDSSFATWLYRLASNACVDFLRSQKRQREAAGFALSLDDEDAPSPPVDSVELPHAQLERRERERALHRALQRLPDHHRQILVMRELQGLSYQEMSQALDLDLGTVKSRLTRARLALRKILLRDGNFFTVSSSTWIENEMTPKERK